jgi:hypothetical protein
MLSKISYSFLIAMWVCNYVWLAYAVKVWNIDILILNLLGSMVSLSFIIYFIYVQHKVKMPTTEIVILVCSFPGIIISFSDIVTPHVAGFLGAFFSMSMYITTLDKVKKVLHSKDPSQLNLLVAVAAGFNGFAWMGYSMLIGDIFIFLPNITGISVSII